MTKGKLVTAIALALLLAGGQALYAQRGDRSVVETGITGG